MDMISDTDHVSPRLTIVRAGIFFGWMLAFMASMSIIGLIPTIPLFVTSYMRLEAREPWKLVICQALGLTLFVYIVFAKLLTLAWPPTLLGTTYPWLADVIPSL